MPSIVLTAEILCSAILFPRSPARKLVVLAAYGGVAQYVDQILEPERKLLAAAAKGGGKVGGHGKPFADAQRARRRALKHRLPRHAPDDICLIGHPTIHEDAMRCVRERGRDNVALWSGLESSAHHRLLDAYFERVDPPDRISRPRRFGRVGATVTKIIVGRGGVDPDLPPLHAARQTGALLVTRSPLLPHFQRVVSATAFDTFLGDPPWTAKFDLRDVDGRLLADPDVWV